MPFTYFFIDKIQREENFDELWLSEVPTPVTFNNNLIIWVDDQPHNNKVLAAEMQNKNLEVIQLTSMEMEKKWTEFGWLLNWMDLKFKVISDMVRFEEGEANYEAGIDLLEHFYNRKGIPLR